MSVSNKSNRSSEDSKQPLGNACTDSTGRLLAALGKGSAQTTFSPALSISNGGLLLALPALCANGLFDSLKTFEFKNKYYRIHDIFIVIAFMVLARIENINCLDGVPSGEWGRLIGLDRIPDKKTLRIKADELSHDINDKNLDNWIAMRSQQWIKPEEDNTIGDFYLDGHVRTYFGKEKLPYRYVARQKLCMRGLTDYWVNDASGNPFFVVTTPFAKGLIASLKADIIPQLLKLVPELTEEELKLNIPRLTIIFDREGFSMKLFKELWDNYRIACQTYNKYPKDDWPITEFTTHTQETIFGTTTEIKIAERTISPLKDFKVREVRYQAESDHQVSIISGDFRPTPHSVITHMKARQSQENYFRYGRQDYNIDTLASYQKIEVDDTVEVINPVFRQLEKDINSTNGKLGRRYLKSKALTLPATPTDNQQKKYEARQGELTAEIEELTAILATKKDQKRTTDKYIQVKDLPEDYKFKTLDGGRKKIIDIIKMICYRAEVAMANLIISELTLYDRDTARNIIKTIFQTSADIYPDYIDKKLHIHLHHMNNRKTDKIVEFLMNQLNQSECIFPGTELKLTYKFVSN